MNKELSALLADIKMRAPMTPEQIREQAESFAVAEMGFGDDADEQAYAIAVLAGDKAEMARLDKKAQQRMDQARAYFRERR